MTGVHGDRFRRADTKRLSWCAAIGSCNISWTLPESTESIGIIGSRELECWTLGVKTPAHKTKKWCAYFWQNRPHASRHLARYFFYYHLFPFQ